MLAYLKSGRQKECGWLRKEEATALKKTTKIHLDPDERSLMIKIRKCAQQLTNLKNPSSNFSPTVDLALAFGVKGNVVRQCGANELQYNGSNKHKQQTDAARHYSTATRSTIKCGLASSISQNFNTKSRKVML